MRAIVSALLLLMVIVPSALFAQVHELPTAANMKVLGLVGGTSWHSTVEYYRYINQEVNDLYGSNTNPPLVLYNLNQNEIHALQLSGRWDQITDILSEAAMKLRAAGEEERCPTVPPAAGSPFTVTRTGFFSGFLTETCTCTDEETPPSRPGIKFFVVAALVVAGIVYLVFWPSIKASLGF